MFRRIQVLLFLVLTAWSFPAAARDERCPRSTFRWGEQEWTRPPAVLTDDGKQAIPSGYFRQQRVRKGLVIGGSVTFATLWVLSAGVAVAKQAEAAPLAIPVAGPVVVIAANDLSGGLGAAMFFDAVGQAVGVAMLVAGLAMKRDVLVRRRILQLDVVPILETRGIGTALRGRF